VIPQHKPALLRFVGRIDDLCYTARLPHVLDLLLAAVVVALAALAFAALK
jgi:hypothetical protein